MAITSAHVSLDVAEWYTTGLAVVVSTALYLEHGHPYLARGVVGDLGGFVVLGSVLAGCRRRARHEALVCLVAIGAVWSIGPAWPVRLPSGFWWVTVVLALGVYLAVRRRMLA